MLTAKGLRRAAKHMGQYSGRPDGPSHQMYRLWHEDEVIGAVKEMVRLHGSESKFAKERGFSRQYVNKVLSGKAKMSAKFLAAVGFEQVNTYRRKRGKDYSL